MTYLLNDRKHLSELFRLFVRRVAGQRLPVFFPKPCPDRYRKRVT
jgi:hypothetical protein